MAEGFARKFLSEKFNVFSAGIAPTKIDPLSVEVMSEINIDISSYKAKKLSDIDKIDFDYVITLCDHAKETCPFFPAKVQLLHKSFEDPHESNKGIESYRKVRDEIKQYIIKLKDDLVY